MPSDDASLKPHWFYILLSLASGDRHGLGISRDVLELSEGRLRLWPATLYGSLEDLCDRRWIEELDAPDDESERKRYYRITKAGRGVVAAETDRLFRLARVARTRLHARTGAAG